MTALDRLIANSNSIIYNLKKFSDTTAQDVTFTWINDDDTTTEVVYDNIKKYQDKIATDFDNYSSNMDTEFATFKNNVNSIISSDDATLDEWQELVDALKANKNTLDNLAPKDIGAVRITDGVMYDTDDSVVEILPTDDVGFFAYCSTSMASTQNSNTALNIFQSTLRNTGNFNTSTGVFTAPVKGVYTFSFGVRVDSVSNSSPYCDIRFAPNGNLSANYFRYNNINDMRALDAVPSYWSFVGSVQFMLDVNETMQLAYYFNSTTPTLKSDSSYFSGQLIKKIA